MLVCLAPLIVFQDKRLPGDRFPELDSRLELLYGGESGLVVGSSSVLQNRHHTSSMLVLDMLLLLANFTIVA